MRRGIVLFHDTPDRPRTVRVAVAQTPEEQRQGLNARDALGLNEGMLFPFDVPTFVAFSMEKTAIALDIIFIQNGRVVQIADATPFSSDPYTSAVPVTAVLEVNGGWCEANNINIGARVTLLSR